MAIEKANTIEERRAHWRQMTIKNTVFINFLSVFAIVDYVFDCLLPGVRKEGLFDINSLPPGKFFMFLLSADSFQNQLFPKVLSGIPSECQTDGIQISLEKMSGLIWVQYVCKSYQQMTLGDKELMG